MKPDELLVHLDRRTAFQTQDWIDQLEPRKREEIDFHNFDRERHDAEVITKQKSQDIYANRKYYSISESSQRWVRQWLKEECPNRVFLDYACGNGARAIEAAELGAALSIGLDISDVSVANAREFARIAGVDGRCRFIQGDCEATELPNSSIDVVLCSGMLHHLDLNRAYPELFRILRPGGKLLGVEALGHNPIIQLYRNLTPHLRTDWEKRHILKARSIRLAENFGFARGRVRFWHLAALAAVPFRRTPLFRAALSGLDSLDELILRLPGLRLMAWQVTFEMIKPASGPR